MRGWGRFRARLVSEKEGTDFAALSSTLRTTLLLLIQGLDKAELRHVLGVTDATLRQRFQALRDLGPFARPRMTRPDRTWVEIEVRHSQIELLPELAARRAARRDGAVVHVGLSDPDGHGMIFTGELTSRRPAATPVGSGQRMRTSTKGISC